MSGQPELHAAAEAQRLREGRGGRAEERETHTGMESEAACKQENMELLVRHLKSKVVWRG